MRTRMWIVCIVIAMALWLVSCTPTMLTEVPPAMVSEWQGEAKIIVAWVDQEMLPVALTIHEDGTIEGRVGDATLVEGSIRSNPVGSEYDMATFLIELANPQQLSPEMATQLQTSQVKLTSELSWGLGPGIQHSQRDDALWQWGQHIDFQSIMIIYPEHGFGVVVCTNNDLLNPDVALEIAHRALGGKIDHIRRAIHLEFNYREGD